LAQRADLEKSQVIQASDDESNTIDDNTIIDTFKNWMAATMDAMSIPLTFSFLFVIT
jgi:hypothetical protein